MRPASAAGSQPWKTQRSATTKTARDARTSGPRFTGDHEPMNATTVQQHEYAVKRGRFVPAAPPDQDERMERQMGRNLYMRGRDISECVTDAMTAGYLAAEAKGADDYYRCMMAEASADKPARWTGEDF